MKNYEKDLLQKLNETKRILVPNGDWVYLGMELINRDIPFTIIPNGDLGVYITIKNDTEI